MYSVKRFINLEIARLKTVMTETQLLKQSEKRILMNEQSATY